MSSTYTYAWCAVADGGGFDGTKLFMHAGTFTEAEFVDYYVRLAANEIVRLPGAEHSMCGHYSIDHVNKLVGAEKMWRCAGCKQYKANSLLTYCLLPTAHICIHIYIYIYMCLKREPLLFIVLVVVAAFHRIYVYIYIYI